MACDAVGNVLLAKFSFHGGQDVCVMIPASVVFWMLRHLPVNQDPNLPPPAAVPQLLPEDWDLDTPRVMTVNCTQFQEGLRMTMDLSRKPDLTVLLDRSNVELMRRFFSAYASELIDLDAE
ncbi:MAG TPA: hypothetical protein VFT37_12935 [Telluria sp.]|nr:hypothetical protein [Telluria sp.]